MHGFRLYLEADEEAMSDLKKTLSKLPKSHRDLVKDFDWAFEPGDTLKDFPGHIGRMDPEKKRITVAAPWNYGREYAILHEIGHLVWAAYVDDSRKQEWERIVRATGRKQRQNPEELFAMAYATTYAKNKVLIHAHKTWDQFVRQIPQ